MHLCLVGCADPSHACRQARRDCNFDLGPSVRTMDFNPGDIGYAPRNYGHYVENIRDTDVQFFAVFRTPNFKKSPCRTSLNTLHRRWRST